MKNNNYNNHISPGTVSKIVWHFTGGPLWDEITKKQKEVRKPDIEAFNNLYNIIKSKELLLGNYKELLHYIIPKTEVFNIDKDEHYFEENIPAIIESKPICCVAEIPIQHLSYHSNRYGKFAIGFYRESLLKHNFNPVLYTLDSENFIYHILRAHENSIFVGNDINTIPDAINKVFEKLHKLNDINDKFTELKILKRYMKFYSSRLEYIEKVLQTVISFIKTISIDEFDTVYCEREWRSMESYKFTYNDVAFIVMPKSYFNNNNIDKISKELSIPRSVPIVPWEDLIEH